MTSSTVEDIIAEFGGLSLNDGGLHCLIESDRSNREGSALRIVGETESQFAVRNLSASMFLTPRFQWATGKLF